MVMVAVPINRILKGSGGRVGVAVGAKVGGACFWHKSDFEVIARLLQAFAVVIFDVLT